MEALTTESCTFAPQHQLERFSTTAPAPSAPPGACRQLRRLRLDFTSPLGDGNAPLVDHVRQQLAALPSLTSLDAECFEIEALDQGDGGAVSTSLTRLVITYYRDPGLPRRLATMFPALRELRLVQPENCFDEMVTDDALEEMLEHLGHVVDVAFSSFGLKGSFTHRAWPWPHLKGLRELDAWTRQGPACRCSASPGARCQQTAIAWWWWPALTPRPRWRAWRRPWGGGAACTGRGGCVMAWCISRVTSVRAS